MLLPDFLILSCSFPCPALVVLILFCQLATLNNSLAALAELMTAAQQRQAAWRRTTAEDEAALEGANADKARLLATAQHGLDEQVKYCILCYADKYCCVLHSTGLFGTALR